MSERPGEAEAVEAARLAAREMFRYPPAMMARAVAAAYPIIAAAVRADEQAVRAEVQAELDKHVQDPDPEWAYECAECGHPWHDDGCVVRRTLAPLLDQTAAARLARDAGCAT